MLPRRPNRVFGDGVAVAENADNGERLDCDWDNREADLVRNGGWFRF